MISKNIKTSLILVVSSLFAINTQAQADKDTMVYEGKRIKVTLLVDEKMDSAVVNDVENTLKALDDKYGDDNNKKTVRVERRVVKDSAGNIIRTEEYRQNGNSRVMIVESREELDSNANQTGGQSIRKTRVITSEDGTQEVIQVIENRRIVKTENGFEEVVETIETKPEVHQDIEVVEERIEKQGKTLKEMFAEEFAKEMESEGAAKKGIDEIEMEFTINDEEDNIKTVKTSWNVMDLGFNQFVNSSNSIGLPNGYSDLELEGASINFHWGIIQQGIRLDKEGKLRFVYGAGIEYNNYRFKKDVDLTADQDELTFEVNEDRDYKKNKLVTQYATIPLMLNFKSAPSEGDNSFNIAAGVQLGYLFRTQQKQKWEENGKQKVKNRGDYNVNDFRYGYVVQIGVGGFNLYGKYYPTPVFKKDQGPEVYTASVGVVLMPF